MSFSYKIQRRWLLR